MTDEEAKRLLFSIRWLGPWERLEEFFLGVRRDGTLRYEIPAHHIPWWLKPMSVLADYANHQDIRWRNRHIRRGTTPWRIWRRKT